MRKKNKKSVALCLAKSKKYIKRPKSYGFAARLKSDHVYGFVHK